MSEETYIAAPAPQAPSATDVAEQISTMPEIVALSDRETFMAGAMLAIMAISLLIFFLKNRLEKRAIVSLAMFSLLIGGFTLFMVLKSAYASSYLVDGIAFFGLLCMFKLMNQFEVTGPPPKKKEEKT